MLKHLEKHGSKVSAALLVGFITIQCKTPHHQSAPKIYGGKQTVAGSWPNVVALTDREGMYCSGTAITPKLVITAAHCLLNHKPEEIAVYVGDGAESNAEINDVFGEFVAKKIEIHPRYHETFPANDVGYIVMEKPLPIPPSTLIGPLTDPKEVREVLTVGYPGTVVGFGYRELEVFGLKFQMESTIRSVGDIEFNFGGDGKDTCIGDSGGPLFLKLKNGGWRFAGITSRGTKGDNCGPGGIYGIVAKHLCWISKNSGEPFKFSQELCAK